MNAVIYYSPTGGAKAVAEEIAQKTDFPPLELTGATVENVLSEKYSTAVLVFPVHCQTYPVFLKKLLARVNAERVAIVAVYGRADAGNALCEAAKLIGAPIIAGAYLPAGHAYLTDGFVSPPLPEEFYNKLKTTDQITLPKRRKTPFAGFLPSARSRFNVKIGRTDGCVGCNACGSACDLGAINKGKTNGKCVRCLKCVKNCPHGALKVEFSKPLRSYLKRAEKEEIIIYT